MAKKYIYYLSSILQAVIARNHAALRDLLERGKPVNSIDNMGWMPLHWAAQLGDLESAKMILSRGMKIRHVLAINEICHLGIGPIKLGVT